MAKIKRGNGIQDIRGSSKGHVYSDWRGRGYLRSKAISGSNPGSSRQADARSSMARFSQIWKAQLTDAQRDLWNQYAKEQAGQKPKMRGAVLIIPYKGFTASGYNTFVQVNRLLFSAGLLAPGAFVSVPPTGTELFNSPSGLAGTWHTPWWQLYYENFLDEINGAKPNAWTPPWLYVDGGGPSQTLVTNAVAPLWPLACLINDAGFPRSHATYVLPGLNVEGSRYDVYAIANQVNRRQSVLNTIDWPPSQNCAFVGFDTPARFWYLDGGVIKFFGSYNAGQVYHFRVVHHPATFTFDIYVDNMDVPAVAGVSFGAAIAPGALYIFQDPSVGIYYTNFYEVIRPRIEGLNLTWTDPSGMHANSRIRIWVSSEEAGVHKQQVADVVLGAQAYTITHVRAAKGSLIPVSSLPGHYWCQLDVVDPAGARSGPSNAILVNVPSSS